MSDPTLKEIEDAFKRHLIKTFECAEFGEFPDGVDFEIDMPRGDIELIQRSHLDRDGRMVRIGIHVTADEMPRLIADHPYLPVAGHPDDPECTHRIDGTDATYCGQIEEQHTESTR